ncbi:hypothetical protein M501DRAFT_998409 [Patellaria atrata CBS 101060]|uniref:Uncharacterized protein n=1 Tax=Patellaria atrata CBS 101060 TaxID=1346257 RepID=A0A9P4SGM4_9PEZI|nr:hypothetical protein M501DRAFT_998409 [Patellaria atrata CBS 101060]
MDLTTETEIFSATQETNIKFAKSYVVQLTESIYATIKSLRAVLDRHGLTIQKRWNKKSHPKRIELLSASQCIPRNYRNRFTTLLDREPPGQWGIFEFLWPHLNVEYLSYGNAFLVLLNSRGCTDPHIFAPDNIYTASSNPLANILRNRYPSDFGMLLVGQTDLANYGRIINASECEGDLFTLAVNVGVGMEVLFMQARTLEFLRRCVCDIMHDYTIMDLYNAVPAIIPETKVLTNDGYFDSLESMIQDAPYRTPKALDFEKLRILVDARKSAAEDHIWTLREDPSYFADCIRVQGEHGWGNTRDLLEKTGQKGKTDMVTTRIAKLFLNAYDSFGVWTFVLGCIEVILEQNRSPSVATRADLQLEEALLELRQALSYFAATLIHEIGTALRTSFPLSKNYAYQEESEGDSGRTYPTVKTTNAIKHYKNDPIVWILHAFVDPNKLSTISIPVLLNNWVHVLRNDPKQRRFTTAFIEDMLMDLALLYEIERQVRAFQPWVRRMETKGKILADKEWLDKNMERAPEEVFEGNLLQQVGEIFFKRLDYPCDKPRTYENLTKMAMVERQLDILWNTIDKHTITEDDDNSVHISLGLIDPETYGLRRVTQADIQHARRLHDASIPAPIPATTQAFQFPTYETSGPSFHRPKEKIKRKSRGPADDQLEKEQDPDEPEGSPAAESPPEVIFVPLRDLNIFKTLFHNPNTDRPPGEIPFSDFRHAMASAGCKTQKLWGSAWSFERTGDIEGRKTIQIHEPHPGGKIAYYIARRWGRRLERTFGWTAETFKREERRR